MKTFLTKETLKQDFLHLISCLQIYRNLGDRGIHLVVLNQHSGKVMARRVFDTFSTGVEEEMVEFIEDVRDGRILVFAVLVSQPRRSPAFVA